MSAGARLLGAEQVKRLLIISAFPVLLNACDLAVDRDIRAYNTCLYRHPQNAVVCEGPRQAYEVDPSIVSGEVASRWPSGGGLPAARPSVGLIQAKTHKLGPEKVGSLADPGRRLAHCQPFRRQVAQDWDAAET